MTAGGRKRGEVAGQSRAGEAGEHAQCAGLCSLLTCRVLRPRGTQPAVRGSRAAGLAREDVQS